MRQGVPILGPRNPPREAQNPDILVPPPTDSGKMPNLRWSFADSRMRLDEAGWARQTTIREPPVATQIAGVNVLLKPGAVRELHWHPNADEWQYYLSGQGRMTVFAANGTAGTFDYQAGDVGYVPSPMPHYVENTGSTTLRFLSTFRSDHYEEVSLAKWLTLTPHELVRAHLNIDESVLAKVPTEAAPIVPA